MLRLEKEGVSKQGWRLRDYLFQKHVFNLVVDKYAVKTYILIELCPS